LTNYIKNLICDIIIKIKIYEAQMISPLKQIYAFCLLTISFSSLQASDQDFITEITLEDVLVSTLHAKDSTIIMGYMHHCSWCVSTKPHFNALAKQYASKMKFYSVNGPQLNSAQHLNTFTTDQKHIGKHILPKIKRQRLLGMNEGIQIPGYPIFICIKRGEIVNIHVGGCSLEILEELIKEVLRK
jgi:thiol-disulfide isomerase/thioredoxin